MSGAARFVSSIFCDDIRIEQGNKLSYMGVYQAKMIVSQMPAVLPKLCIVITVRTDFDNPFQDLLLRVLRDDEIVAELTIDPDKLQAERDTLNESDANSNNRFIAVTGMLALSPFAIDMPAVLRVRAIIGDEELKGPGLMIERAS